MEKLYIELTLTFFGAISQAPGNRPGVIGKLP